MLRERTGSLYPGIALHCLNNSLAFGVSQHWGWEIPVLFSCSLGLIALVGLTVRARWTPAPTPTG
jgi:membrane protease YdiL (CAAX protease family)